MGAQLKRPQAWRTLETLEVAACMDQDPYLHRELGKLDQASVALDPYLHRELGGVQASVALDLPASVALQLQASVEALEQLELVLLVAQLELVLPAMPRSSRGNKGARCHPPPICVSLHCRSYLCGTSRIPNAAASLLLIVDQQDHQLRQSSRPTDHQPS